MYVADLATWKYSQLKQVLAGIGKLQAAAGWSDADFINAMTGGGKYQVGLYRQNMIDVGNKTYGRTFLNEETKTISVTFADGAFTHGDTMAQITTVHELAHVWDDASGGTLSNNMAAATNGYIGCSWAVDCILNGDNHYVPGGAPASNLRYEVGADRFTAAEDWAEAVAGSVFVGEARYTNRLGQPRMDQTSGQPQ
jgi:hypothetical protein